MTKSLDRGQTSVNSSSLCSRRSAPTGMKRIFQTRQLVELIAASRRCAIVECVSCDRPCKVNAIKRAKKQTEVRE